jgi:hypothetical protein
LCFTKRITQPLRKQHPLQRDVVLAGRLQPSDAVECSVTAASGSVAHTRPKINAHPLHWHCAR